MAHELNLEKTQFRIEEIMKFEDNLDHQSMDEDGWDTISTTPQDTVTYANVKWFRVSLKTGEDLIPPHSKPFEGVASVNIGPKGSPHYVFPPATGYQSMTAMAMLAVLRSKLTLCYSQDCTIFSVRLEDIVGFRESGEMQRSAGWMHLPELRDSPLRWKTIMELSCWTGKIYEDTKSLCQCNAVGVKAFLLLASDILNGIVAHSGDNSWQQIVLDGDTIEMTGRKPELMSYLKEMQSVLPSLDSRQEDGIEKCLLVGLESAATTEIGRATSGIECR